MNTIKKFMHALRHREEGVTAIEYGLIASLIAVAIIGATGAVGTALNATFGSVSSHL